MLDDDTKLMARQELFNILQQHNLNSTLTEDAETGEPFLIVESWQELATIQRELNRAIAPEAYYQNAITYYNLQGRNAFQNMRLEAYHLYPVPEGLFELDDVLDWGFSDEFTTCGACGNAVRTTPTSYNDKTRYAILNNESLCGNCIATDFEKEYIDSCIYRYTKAVNTNIIPESRLAELGWIKQAERYESGMHLGQTDNPKDVFNKYRDQGDLLFTYEVGQFDINFWVWVKKEET